MAWRRTGFLGCLRRHRWRPGSPDGGEGGGGGLGRRGTAAAAQRRRLQHTRVPQHQQMWLGGVAKAARGRLPGANYEYCSGGPGLTGRQDSSWRHGMLM
eukprot:SM000123S25876  [mRNA]  locus=s123:293224:294154:- [translate_table: standard]